MLKLVASKLILEGKKKTKKRKTDLEKGKFLAKMKRVSFQNRHKLCGL